MTLRVRLFLKGQSHACIYICFLSSWHNKGRTHVANTEFFVAVFLHRNWWDHRHNNHQTDTCLHIVPQHFCITIQSDHQVSWYCAGKLINILVLLILYTNTSKTKIISTLYWDLESDFYDSIFIVCTFPSKIKVLLFIIIKL